MFVIAYKDINKPVVFASEDKAAVTTFFETFDKAWSAQHVESEGQLSLVPAAVLIALYNTAKPDAVIKKFENRHTAFRRVWPLLAPMSKPLPEARAEASTKETTEPAPKAPRQKKVSDGRGTPRQFHRPKLRTIVLPRAGSKAETVAAMLRAGTTYDKIKEKFGWGSQGVFDILSYLHRKCGYGISTDANGRMTLSE